MNCLHPGASQALKDTYLLGKVGSRQHGMERVPSEAARPVLQVSTTILLLIIEGSDVFIGH